MSKVCTHANGEKWWMVNKTSWRDTSRAIGFKKHRIGSNIFGLLLYLLRYI